MKERERERGRERERERERERGVIEEEKKDLERGRRGEERY